MNRRVYVVGPYIPNGGTFMAYHLARLLHLEFGFSGVAVQAGDETPGHGVFAYDPVFPTVSLEAMTASATPADVLIANPSFSALALGLRCPCRKIMYVQGFSTFDVIDPHFDLYVSVSGTVQRFLRMLYGIETRVIPPFAGPFPDAPPWEGRPGDGILVSLKGHPERRNVVFSHVQALSARRGTAARMVPLPDARMPHGDLLRLFGRYRYFLSLSPAEGFGLMPLEAMAMGCLVLGFDGFGGRDYFRPGINALVRPHGDLDGIAQDIGRALGDPVLARVLAARGRETARTPLYGRDRFLADWRAALYASGIV